MKELTPRQAHDLLQTRADVRVLDVREHGELDLARLPGTIHLPLGEIPRRLHELAPGGPVIVLCHHGVRSVVAADFLERAGFSEIFNLRGGIDAWSRDLDPEIPRY
jgi:rhodanese-related sulfurtransferase